MKESRTAQGEKRLAVWVSRELFEKLNKARDGRPIGFFTARLIEQALADPGEVKA